MKNSFEIMPDSPNPSRKTITRSGLFVAGLLLCFGQFLSAAGQKPSTCGTDVTNRSEYCASKPRDPK